MKLIVMWQGMGINERGWARLVSAWGRVILVQQGLIMHVEIWESGTRVFDGPTTRYTRLRPLDEILLGAISALWLLFSTLKLTRGQKIDLIVAANYHSGLMALLLRAVGKTRRVVSFLTDHMPPGGSRLIRIHRRITTGLMRFVAKRADEVWSLSPRIPAAQVNPRNFVVPICISSARSSVRGPREEVAYIGFPSPDHALDVLFDICGRNRWRLNVIGDSPYLQSIKHTAPPDTVFHGLLNDEDRIGDILVRCFCGYAIYRNVSPSSYSYYGFPSKSLYCFANNVPIVITNVAHFNQNFEKYGVGRVVEPVPEEIERAMRQLKENYETFSTAIDRFRVEWNAQVEEFHRQRLAALEAENPLPARQDAPSP